MTLLTFLLYLILGLLTVVLLTAGYFAFLTRRIAARAERLVPPRGKFVDVGGSRIHYVEQGEGRPILFIHGLGAYLHHFRHPLFADFGDGYRLIAIDRAGSGYSTRAKGLTGRLPEQAGQVAALIDALGLEKPLLVGHSLGGAIALATALDYPEKISGLALIAPYTHHETEVPPEFAGLKIRSPLLRRVISSTIALPLAIRHRQATLDFVFGPQQAPPDYAVEGGALSGLRPGHFYATATDYVAVDEDLPKLQTRYGELKMPVGILFGTEDRVLNYERQGLKMQGKIEGLELEIIQGVGHMPQYAVTDRVISFIKRMAERAFAHGNSRSIRGQSECDQMSPLR
jgi:pimeloyl-ACP methyl ester carboxylesterase